MRPRIAAILLATMLVLSLSSSPAGAEPVSSSCYGSESGTITASGETFDPSGFTAASPYLPFGTVLLASYGDASVAVTVTDRGPAEWTGRDLDLSMASCDAIGLTYAGVDVVEVVVL